MPTVFECNDLKIKGNKIHVRRGNLGTSGTACGMRKYKYTKSKWNAVNTGKKCPDTGNDIWQMTSIE